MGQEFKITITAADKASDVIDQINDKMDRITQPIERTRKAANLLDKEKGIANTGRAIWKMGEHAFVADKRIGSMVGTMLGAGGKLGFAGGAIATAAATTYAANKVGKFGFEVSRTSRLLGISERDLQRYRFAANLAGISQDKMTNSIHAFGMAAQNAKWGRDPNALIGLNMLNVPIKYTETGAVDTLTMMQEVFKTLGDRNIPVQTKEMAASLLGLSEILPVIADGTVNFRQLLGVVDKSNAVMSDAGVRAAEEFEKKLLLLELRVKGVANTFLEWLIPSASTAITLLEKGATVYKSAADSGFTKGWGFDQQGFYTPEGGFLPNTPSGGRSPGGHLHRMGKGSAEWIPDTKNNWSVAQRATREEIMHQLTGYGWTEKQAAGMIASFMRESSLNPQAVSPSGRYKGMAQLSPERQRTFAKVMGKDVMSATASEQVAYTNWELNNTHRAAGNLLRKTRTSEDASDVFTRYYEIPGDMEREMALRRKMATSIPLSADGATSAGSPGKITVDVNFQNAPQGTKVRNYVEGPVSANTRIGYSNPGTL